MILGNKCDVEDKRAVSKEKGEMVGFRQSRTFYIHSNNIWPDAHFFLLVVKRLQENTELGLWKPQLKPTLTLKVHSTN